MRWDWRDWVAGVAVTVVAVVLVYLFALSPRQVSELRIGMPRAEVEEYLGGPGEESPNFRFYSISLFPPPGVPSDHESRQRSYEATREAVHTEERWYPHPTYRIEIEYAGYRDPRLKRVTITPIWRPTALCLFIVPLLFAATAEVSRLRRRKFTVPSPA